MNGKNGELAMKFTKMQGLGNDYVYVNCFKETIEDPSAVAKFVSNRNFGIGSDGLILICPSETADFQMVMYNADGSRGEMCGNGIRCVAKYVYDKGLTDKTTFTIETLSGIKTIDVTLKDGKVAEASVDMGKPVLKCTDIPMISDHFVFVDQGLVIAEDVVYNGTAVSMGNPHFVTFVDDVDSLDLEKLGPLFEHHKLFPEGVNTEFVQVIDKNTVKFRVWERGSGETWACGTGACAVAVACVTLNNAGKRDEELKVIAKGGELKVTYRKDDSVILKGPATLVFDGVIDIPDEIVSK